MVKHRNKSWKIKTVEGGAKGTGNDYQEDELNGERLCSYFVAYKTFCRQLNIGSEHIIFPLAVTLVGMSLFKSTKGSNRQPHYSEAAISR